MRGPVCALLLLVAGPASAAAPPLQRPLLFFGPNDVPALQRRATRGRHAAIYRDLKRLLDDNVRLPNLEVDSILMECDIGGLVYTITGDRAYAARAKPHYLRRLKAWASEIPAYDYAKRKHRISLFISRLLQTMCVEFDLLAPSGVFTEAEQGYARDTLAMVVARLMERGDSFNPYDYFSTRFRGDNWNTDRIMAVGMFALAFPEHPQSQAWLAHATEELAWQLEHDLLPDGAWPESTRYHGAVLRCMVPFAHALRRSGGRDFFAHPRFGAMFESLIPLQTPRIAGLDDAALLPGVGNANWESIWEAVLAWGASGFAAHDAAFAGRLMWAWERAGAPFLVELSPGNPVMGFLLIDPQLEPLPQPALTSTLRPGGFAILRGGFDTEAETYFHFNVGRLRKPWQHQHRDRGSFSLIAHNTLLTVDPGVRDYADSLAKWFVHSRAHNQVVFDNADSRDAGTIRDHFFSHTIDYVAADLTDAVGGRYERHVFFVKPHFVLLWDRIVNLRPAVYHLHVLPDPKRDRPPTIEPDRVSFACENGVDLDVVLLSPATAAKQIDLAADPYAIRLDIERNAVPTRARVVTPHWLKIQQARPGQDFVTVLHPRRAAAPPLRLVRVETAAIDGQPMHDESLRAELAVGATRITFLLGSQRHDDLSLDGQAGVILHSAPNRPERIFVAQVSRLATPRAADLIWPEPRTTLTADPR